MLDITRRLTDSHPVWPGDTPFTLRQSATLGEASSVNIMALSTSTHIGTHVDAPYHYHAKGRRLGEIPLELLSGSACVIGAQGRDPVDADVLAGHDNLPARVLIATGQVDDWDAFPEEFAPLTTGLVRSLAERGVRVVGTDSPSVDRFDSKDLPVHAACLAHDVIIIEGLALATVPAGGYRLVCLPLNVPEADAAPVRAVLLPP